MTSSTAFPTSSTSISAVCAGNSTRAFSLGCCIPFAAAVTCLVSCPRTTKPPRRRLKPDDGSRHAGQPCLATVRGFPGRTFQLPRSRVPQAAFHERVGAYRAPCYNSQVRWPESHGAASPESYEAHDQNQPRLEPSAQETIQGAAGDHSLAGQRGVYRGGGDRRPADHGRRRGLQILQCRGTRRHSGPGGLRAAPLCRQRYYLSRRHYYGAIGQPQVWHAPTGAPQPDSLECDLGHHRYRESHLLRSEEHTAELQSRQYL